MTLLDKVEIISGSFTHVGKVRKENEDSLKLCDPGDEFTAVNGHLYAIADGMGGYALGDKASSLALETFFDTFYDSDGIPTMQKIKVGIQNANLSVYQTAQKLGVGRMGTTLTAVNIKGHHLYVGHVGDTRAYLVRHGKATCVTNDHTRVGELVRMKMLTPEKVRTHNQRSVLEKCLGFNLFVQPDVFKIGVQNDDILILCSDGIWSVIEDDEFAEIASSKTEVNVLSEKIGEAALSRDHDDNLSVIVLHLKQLNHFKDENDEKKEWSLQKIFRRFVK